jgi:hypothetical protein
MADDPHASRCLNMPLAPRKKCRMPVLANCGVMPREKREKRGKRTRMKRTCLMRYGSDICTHQIRSDLGEKTAVYGENSRGTVYK